MPSRLGGLAWTRRRAHGGEALFNAGDPFTCLYAVDGGFFKTRVFDAEGHEQVTGFFMGGELLGLEGIGLGHYSVTATALEDSLVGVLPYTLIEELSRGAPGLQHELNVALSRQIARGHEVLMLLGSMRAEERVAAFLLDLSARFKERGYSQSEFGLRMTRREVGSYLGLTLETVSRLLSRFRKQGVIEVRQKRVRLLDAARLRAMVNAAAG
jgi:CRP/FNR family transcriptional regulator